MLIHRTAVVLLCLAVPIATFAGIARTKSSHAVPSILALRGQRQNVLSNIEFFQSNYGALFLNINAGNSAAGAFWPRGSNFQYIFGGGPWFGCVRQGKRHVSVGYDLYNSGSWFQPGTVASAKHFFDSTRIATGTGRYPNDGDAAYVNTFPVYSSLQYDRQTGKPLDPAGGLPNWPIWDTNPDSTAVIGRDHYFGNYVEDERKRDTSVYPVRTATIIETRYDSTLRQTVTDTVRIRKGGPAFVSEEDMFSVCNEIDTSKYFFVSPGRTYPLSLELQRMIYSWGTPNNTNLLFVTYRTFNRSATTLDSCWAGIILDPDIGDPSNDDGLVYRDDPSLNLALQWSDMEPGVPGAKHASGYPGVLGMSLLESPAIYKPGETTGSLVGTIKPGVYPRADQLGLVSYRRWSNVSDPRNDDDRFTLMATHTLDEYWPGLDGDRRFLMATGPFKLLAGQSAQVAVSLMFARNEATGDSDLTASKAECIALAKHAQTVYDQQYHVDDMSLPPTIPHFYAPTPGDHHITLHWDSLAEYSYDPYRSGLDFLGYRLYRSRSSDAASRRLVAEWNLGDLDTAALQALHARIPADTAPADVRRAFYELIHHHMDSLTNHHTYDDTGDDNHDGVVTNEERLPNDVDYYYWITSFDAGDGTFAGPSRESSPADAPLFSHAVSNDTGQHASYVFLDRGRDLGGIAHFRWEVQNKEIINQLLAGDTVSVSFHAAPTLLNSDYRSYDLKVQIVDRRALIIDSLHITPEQFSTAPFGASNSGGITYRLQDTTGIGSSLFGEQYDRVFAKPIRTDFRSGSSAFGTHATLLNALSYSFSANYLQCITPIYTDSVQLIDTTFVVHGLAHSVDTEFVPGPRVPSKVGWALLPYGLSARKTYTPLRTITGSKRTYEGGPADTLITCVTQWAVDSIVAGQDPFALVAGRDTVAMYVPVPGTYSFDAQEDLGPYDFIVTFQPGGTEDITVRGITYRVPYLNMQVTCEQFYTTPDVHGADSLVIVTAPGIPVDADTTSNRHGHHWTMDPMAWVLSPNNNTDGTGSTRAKQYAGFGLVKSNRYYLTAHGLPPGDTNYLIFINRMSIGGDIVYLDSAFKTPGRFTRSSTTGQFLRPATHDLRAGDILRIRFAGGTMGMPVPGATINTVFKSVAGITPGQGIPLSYLSAIDAWPNPVYGRREKLALSNLPERCAIELCTITGECIARISHREGSQEAIDLAAAGVARRGTQLLVARIVTPDGASRAVKIVVLGDGR